MTFDKLFKTFILTILIVGGVSTTWQPQTQNAYAITVVQVFSDSDLLSALLAGGGTGIDTSTVTISVSNQGLGLPGLPTSTAIYFNPTGTYGIGDGIVISSGDVQSYNDGPNTSGDFTTAYGVPATLAQEALLDPITGGGFSHFDVTQIDISFDMLPGFNDVFFNMAFGSEEFPEWVGTDFIDGFGLYVNGVNIASVAGSPVNINHPSMGFFGGTELDGVLGGSTGSFGALVHTFSSPVNPAGNTITFIISDTSDDILDTTAFISQLGGTPPTLDPCDGIDNNNNGIIDEGTIGVDDDNDGIIDEEGDVCLPPPNTTPDCNTASPSMNPLWPPNHKMASVTIVGIVDDDGDTVSTLITNIFQDEPVKGKGSGNTSPDGTGVGTDTAELRAEKSGSGNGRVYHIGFTADDGNGGVCSGEILVSVPHDQRGTSAIDDGALFDSTTP